jgi:hypothetical protein
MPRYVIERQYLLPVYDQLLIEAPSLDVACREALDEDAHPWGEDAREDYDTAGAVTVRRAVELPARAPLGFDEGDGPEEISPGDALYGVGLQPLPIPAEFSDDK